MKPDAGGGESIGQLRPRGGVGDDIFQGIERADEFQRPGAEFCVVDEQEAAIAALEPLAPMKALVAL